MTQTSGTHPDGSDVQTPVTAGGKPLVTWSVSVVFVMAMLVIHQVWSLGYFSNDAAYFDYTYRHIGDGGVPYRDFFVVHGPITYWLSRLFQPFGPSAFGTGLLGVAGYLVLVASTISLAFRACGTDRAGQVATRGTETYCSRLIPESVSMAILAATVTGGWYLIAWFVPFGGRPKFLAVGLLMFAVSAMSTRRAVVAGILLALACWTWQAAIVQTCGLVIVWTVLGLTKRSRTVRADLIKLVIAVLCVSGGCALILVLQGAWDDFLQQAVEFPIKYQRHTLEVRNVPARGIMRLLVPAGLLWKYLPKSFLIVVAASLVGWLVVVSRGAAKLNGSTASSRPVALEGQADSCVMTARAGIITLLAFGYLQLVSVTHGPGYVVPLLAPFGPLTGWIAWQANPELSKGRKWFGPVLVAISLLLLLDTTRQSYSNSSWLSIARSVLRGNWSLVDGRRREIWQDLNDYQAVVDALRAKFPGPANVVVHGEPRLRALLGGEPLEGDVQWIYGRYDFLEGTYKGGSRQGGGARIYAEDLIRPDPAGRKPPDAVYVSERAGEIERDMVSAMGDEYAASPDIAIAGRPLYVRVEK